MSPPAGATWVAGEGSSQRPERPSVLHGRPSPGCPAHTPRSLLLSGMPRVQPSAYWMPRIHSRSVGNTEAVCVVLGTRVGLSSVCPSTDFAAVRSPVVARPSSYSTLLPLGSPPYVPVLHTVPSSSSPVQPSPGPLWRALIVSFTSLPLAWQEGQGPSFPLLQRLGASAPGRTLGSQGIAGWSLRIFWTGLGPVTLRSWCVLEGVPSPPSPTFAPSADTISPGPVLLFTCSFAHSFTLPSVTEQDLKSPLYQ